LQRLAKRRPVEKTNRRRLRRPQWSGGGTENGYDEQVGGGSAGEQILRNSNFFLNKEAVKGGGGGEKTAVQKDQKRGNWREVMVGARGGGNVCPTKSKKCQRRSWGLRRRKKLVSIWGVNAEQTSFHGLLNVCFRGGEEHGIL